MNSKTLDTIVIGACFLALMLVALAVIHLVDDFVNAPENKHRCFKSYKVIEHYKYDDDLYCLVNGEYIEVDKL